MTNYRMKRLQNTSENKQRIIMNTRQKIAMPKKKTFNWTYMTTSMAVIVFCIFGGQLLWESIMNPTDNKLSSLFIEKSEVETVVIDIVEPAESVTINDKETIGLIADWLNEVSSESHQKLEGEQEVIYQIYIQKNGYYPSGAISITSDKMIIIDDVYEITNEQFTTISNLIVEVMNKENDIVFDVPSFGTVNEELLKEFDDVISGKTDAEIFAEGIPNAVHTVRINNEGIAIVDFRSTFKTSMVNGSTSHVKGEMLRTLNPIIFNNPQVTMVYYLLEGNFSEWTRWLEFTEEPITREMWEETTTAVIVREILIEKSEEIFNFMKSHDWASFTEYIHPGGVTFSFDAAIGFNHNNSTSFTRQTLEQLGKQNSNINWGTDDSDQQFILSINDYVDQYLFKHLGNRTLDYQVVTFNESSVKPSGVINTIHEKFPDAKYVEYYAAPENDLDWQALRFVFKQSDNEWYLAAVVRDVWAP